MGVDELNSNFFEGANVGNPVGDEVGLIHRGADFDCANPKKCKLKNTAVSMCGVEEDTVGGTLQRHLSTSEHVPLFVPSSFSFRRSLSK